MNLHTTLENELHHSSKQTIAEALAYNSTKKALKALDSFINHENIYSWLHSGHYDFKYNAVEFLKKLSKILGFSDEEINLELENQRLYQKELDRFDSYYIFVDTHFKRDGQTLISLACLSGKRYIRVPTQELLHKTDKEIFEITSKFIVQHYKNTNGELPLFGKIQNYQYHHIDGEIYTFGVNGKLQELVVVEETKVTISVGGKVLC